jgi:hypothetical protein
MYPEEKVKGEDVEVAEGAHVKHPEQIVERLRLGAILERQHKVEVRLVVHLAVVRQTLLEHPLHEHRRQRPRSVPEQKFIHKFTFETSKAAVFNQRAKISGS